MTNTDPIDLALGEQKEGSRCMWQITPKELPEDMRAMALEMWQTSDGKLHLFQLFVSTDQTDPKWFSHVDGVVHFVQDA